VLIGDIMLGAVGDLVITWFDWTLRLGWVRHGDGLKLWRRPWWCFSTQWIALNGMETIDGARHCRPTADGDDDDANKLEGGEFN